MKGNDKLITAFCGPLGEPAAYRRSQIVVGSILTIIFILLLTACAQRAQPAGTAWGRGDIRFELRANRRFRIQVVQLPGGGY